MDNSKIVDGLNDLLTKNYDAETGFKEAADNTKDAKLKSFFFNRANQRYNFGHEIKKLIATLGGTPDKGTSVKGDLHRAWFKLREMFALNSEEALLEEVERGEEACLKEYNEFLENYDLPANIYKAIEEQRNLIKLTLDKADLLEDVYEKS
ncbi:MAG: PA2169 family four-helix-bundle protein [Saprospiraceae bacterium]